MKLKLVLYALVAVGVFANTAVFAQSYAITNARVVTVSGSVIDRGTVVVRDGLIESVGSNVAVPADARVFDGSGLTVYPGFIDALTSLGIATPTPPAGGGGGGGGGGGMAAFLAQQQQNDTSNSNYQIGLRPELQAAQQVMPNESQFTPIRNAGVTTVLTVGRTGVFNGQSAIINLAGDSASSMIVSSPTAMHISFVTTPGRFPGSLLGTFAALRQMFHDAKRHQQLLKMYADNPRGMRRPEADASLEALIPVVEGRMPAVFNANTETEIIRALDLGKEFNLKMIIAGGQEAWKAADRLKAQDVAVLLSLNMPRRTTASHPDADPEPLQMLRFRAETPKGAGILHKAGVKFAFQSGGGNITDYLNNAGTAVQSGLDQNAAIRALTLGSAEILGVSNRLGSIEPGKIANLTVVRGDIFNRSRVITHVFVDGKLFEQKPPAARPAGPGQGQGGRPGQAGQAAPGGATPASIAGTYTITVNIPDQPMPGTMTLVVNGDALTGSMVTELGASTIRSGKVTGDRFTFVASVEFGGMTMEITVNGSVSGNNISGSIASPQGDVPFSGTRNP